MNSIRNQHKPSLLLVDDDPTLCRVLAQALSNRGYVVTVAHTVEGAARAAQEVSLECAVIDLKIRVCRVSRSYRCSYHLV